MSSTNKYTRRSMTYGVDNKSINIDDTDRSVPDIADWLRLDNQDAME